MSKTPVVLITGARRGLGRAAATALARQGYSVVLTARRVVDARAAALEVAEEAPGSVVVAEKLDVTQGDDARRVAEFVMERFGRLDVVINNAGTILEDRSAPDALGADPDLVLRSFENNALGALRVAQAMAPLLRAQGGNIVNVSSGMGGLSDMDGGYAGYRVSKTALNAITRILHAELNMDGVRVNSVCPGWVRTELGGPGATRSLEEGVAGIVWAATLDSDGPSGGFFRDGVEIAW
ncbi:MAG: SDR family NAD(P)-dependent oxidoreductase [Deltaproteobacteria bacterium]|nr:SDR family NAD(P)-dependent oxidoreductase [Deltaproteobacteria bacterium]